MEFREHTLDNGLEVIAECNPSAYSTSVAFFVKTGSRDETDDIAGVSHFLEHMVFKGTPRRSAVDVNRELDEIGSHSNAYTSEEQTVYYASMLPEYLNDALDLLADLMRPSLREEDFDSEKKVIIEEISKYDDQPPFGAHEKCMASFFGKHPLGNSVLGTVETVQGLTTDAMRSYFQSRYSPGNITLAATGKVDFDAFVKTAQDLCGSWKSYEAERRIEIAKPASEFIALTKEIATQQYSIQISPGPAATDPDRFATRLLATIVGDDTGSRFYWDLVDTGIAEYAGIGPYEFQGAGIMMAYICSDPDRAESNLQLVHNILHTIEDSGVTEDELELAKSKICSQLVRQAERPSSRLFSIGNSWLQRRSYTKVRDRVDSYRGITVDDIDRVIRKYPFSESTTVTVGPLKSVARPK